MAIIDASEMPDTYGSPFDETRGFLQAMNMMCANVIVKYNI